VLGLYYYAWNGLAPVGALIVGWLCDHGGTELAFAVSGGAGVAAVAAGALALHDLRLRERPVALEVPLPDEAAG
jgi:hypothetical protein